MSDKKMIIRNCPAFDSKYNECHSKIEPHKIYCMDCTDCVLKQIIEKCKYCINAEKNNKYKTNGWMLSDDILRLLDIQEVE